RLHDCGNHAIRGLDVNKCGLRWQIHVPQIVVHGLVRPHALAGVDVQGDERARVALNHRLAVPTPDVRARRTHGDIYETQLGIVRRRYPGIWRTVAIGVSRRGQGILVLRSRVPGPYQRAGVNIEAADDTGWHVR